jgi:hypothetical protein
VSVQLQQYALSEQIAHDIAERARLLDRRIGRWCDIQVRRGIGADGFVGSAHAEGNDRNGKRSRNPAPHAASRKYRDIASPSNAPMT